MRIVLDTKYPAIISRCREAIELMMPGQHASASFRNTAPAGSTTAASSSSPGRKYIVSVYRKAATARLDEFVGPKSVAVPWTNVHYTA